MLDETGGRLVGDEDDEGNTEEDEQEMLPVVSHSVGLSTFFPFFAFCTFPTSSTFSALSTFVCATAPDDPKQPKIERNPEPGLRDVVPQGILPGSSVVVEP